MTEIHDIHEPFMRYLRDKGIEFTRARSDKASTIEKGACDFVLHHPAYPSIFIEFKWGKGVLTAAQKRVHARLRGRGHLVWVCRSLKESVEVTEQWLNGLTFRKPASTNVEPARAEFEERQLGGNVWRSPVGKNDWRFDRKATAADSLLPKLIP